MLFWNKRKLENRVDWGKGMNEDNKRFRNTGENTGSQSCSYRNQPSGPAAWKALPLEAQGQCRRGATGTGMVASGLCKVVRNPPSEGCKELAGCGKMQANGW